MGLNFLSQWNLTQKKNIVHMQSFVHKALASSVHKAWALPLAQAHEEVLNAKCLVQISFSDMLLKTKTNIKQQLRATL